MKRTAVFHTILLVTVLPALLVGCLHRSGHSGTPASDIGVTGRRIYPCTIIDDQGKRVTILSEPRRIVSLAPSNTEILYALGLGNRVVGVTRYCNYPREAAAKPKVGDSRISVEKVLTLRPDLVLAHGFLNQAATRQLQRLGVTVVALDPRTLGEVQKSISLVGKICNRPKAAARLNRRMSLEIRRIRELSKSRSGLRTLVVIQPNPLWVAGPETFVDEMLSICNAPNIAHDARPGFNQFPVERAIARDPQVIITGTEREREFFLNSPVWKHTSAIKEGRIVVINADLLVRPGPRLTLGLARLSAVANPASRRYGERVRIR